MSFIQWLYTLLENIQNKFFVKKIWENCTVFTIKTFNNKKFSIITDFSKYEKAHIVCMIYNFDYGIQDYLKEVKKLFPEKYKTLEDENKLDLLYEPIIEKNIDLYLYKNGMITKY